MHPSDKQFIEDKVVVLMHSDLLDEDFYIVPTQEVENEIKAEHPDVITYLPHEIRELSRLKPEEVKKAHLAKKMFNGQFVHLKKREWE